MTAEKQGVLLAARRADLDASGLGKPGIIKKLRLTEVLSKAQTSAVTGVEDAVSYEIPYFGPRGEDIKYSRWKLIALTDEDLGIKYYQEAKTIPRLYLPPVVDWEAICADTSKRIIITEGEKKAACASLLGLPCLSVGGVWAWKSRGWNLKKIPDFDWFDWRGRDVEVCYDGDMYTNDDVARALDALVGLLSKLGARIFIRRLPTQDGISKLDDFLVARGVKPYLALECPEADTSRQMSNLNEDLVYVKDIMSWFSTYERILYGTETQIRRRYGDIRIMSDTGRPIAAIDEWMRWPHRRMVERITYAPGEQQFVRGELNAWPGWGVEPKRGNCSQFLDLVRSVENWEWFLQWLAYPIQYPGAKMFTAVMIWSVEQGTGKTFIGDVMRDIYGQNANVITSVELHDDSLVWAQNKQFILGEEVSQTRSRSDAGILKHLITGASVRVNEKYVKQYELPNRSNFMFTSNQPDAIFIDPSDRRFFVGELNKARPQKWWRELDRWRKKQGGPAAFMYYLQNNVDVSRFDPEERPPETEDKKQMQYMGMTSLEQWVCDLMADPVGIMEGGSNGVGKLHRERDVFRIEQLMDFLPENLEREANNVKLGKALTKLGAIPAGVVRLSSGQARLYAIRNLDHWREHLTDKRKWAANFEGLAKTKKVAAKKVTKIGRRKKG